jgi:hypothetical protein
MMDLMWLFTVPVLKLAIKIAVGLGATFLFVQVLTRDSGSALLLEAGSGSALESKFNSFRGSK